MAMEHDAPRPLLESTGWLAAHRRSQRWLQQNPVHLHRSSLSGEVSRERPSKETLGEPMAPRPASSRICGLTPGRAGFRVISLEPTMMGAGRSCSGKAREWWGLKMVTLRLSKWLPVCAAGR